MTAMEFASTMEHPLLFRYILIIGYFIITTDMWNKLFFTPGIKKKSFIKYDTFS